MADTPDDIFEATSKNPNGEVAVLIITADGTEDSEFFYPYYRFLEQGYRVHVATPGGKGFKGKNGTGLSETMDLANIQEADYDFLYIPGGKAPEALKKEDKAIAMVKNFVEDGKLVAAICHGPQLLAKADVIEGKSIAAFPEVETEVNEARGTYKNEECVIDGQFVTARWPGDLPKFTRTVIDRFEQSDAVKRAA